ncbi:MAG: PadR family transcriptional regulator [bacterium]|nr:PadR family transcriptional regulator [bacterium]
MNQNIGRGGRRRGGRRFDERGMEFGPRGYGRGESRGRGEGYGRGERYGREGFGPGEPRRRGEGRGRGEGFGPGEGRRRGEGYGRPGYGGHGPGHGGRGGGPRRARRGDVRIAVLLLLAEQPSNGYQMMQELSERSEGAWRVSSGAMYPALAQLQDEGLVEQFEQDGRQMLRLTDAGEAQVSAHGDKPKPWDQAAHAQSERGGDALRTAMGQLMLAVKSVERAGDPQLAATAATTLDDAKRSLYRLLADGPEADAEGDGAGADAE